MYNPIMSRSSKLSLSLWCLPPNTVNNSPLPHTCHVLRPSKPSLMDHSNNRTFDSQNTKQSFSLYSLSLVPCYLVPLRHNYDTQHLFSNRLSLRSSLNVSNQVSQPYKKTAIYNNNNNNFILIIIIIVFSVP
jgi:hypothetical protein